MVGRVFVCALVCLLSVAGCSPSEPPKPVATATPLPAASPTSVVTPAIAASGEAAPDLSDFSDTDDWDWNLAEEAEGTDFEIDADATAYFMPIGNVVTFKVKALNGTPPFECTWDFADGSPMVKGDLVKHKYTTNLGHIDVSVRCFDASKAAASMQLGLRITTMEEWRTRTHMNDDAPSPSPGVTP